MNEFTKDELKDIDYALETVYLGNSNLRKKIQSMIDSYQADPWNVKKIAKSHLQESVSLISHAMCLLGIEDE